MDALRSLANRPFLHAYDRRVYQDDKGKDIRIEAVAPLMMLAQADGELTITPSPVLVDQVDAYFAWKPMDRVTLVRKSNNVSYHM